MSYYFSSAFDILYSSFGGDLYFNSSLFCSSKRSFFNFPDFFNNFKIYASSIFFLISADGSTYIFFFDFLEASPLGIVILWLFEPLGLEIAVVYSSSFYFDFSCSLFYSLALSANNLFFSFFSSLSILSCHCTLF